MVISHATIYDEVKLLRAEVRELKNLIVPEVEPDKDEIEAIQEGEKEFKSGEYTNWKALKNTDLLSFNRTCIDKPYSKFLIRCRMHM